MYVFVCVCVQACIYKGLCKSLCTIMSVCQNVCAYVFVPICEFMYLIATNDTEEWRN